MKGSVHIAVGDGQQAPHPRVELGIRDHHLNESQWCRVVTGVHGGSCAILVLVEELIGRATVREALEMVHVLVQRQLVQHAVNVHSPAGAARVG